MRMTPVLRLLAAGLLAFGLAACESAETRIAGHMARGKELVAAGDDDKARLEFANALKLAPELVEAHLEMARLLERRQALGPMAGHLNKVIEHEPANVWALVRLARFAAIAGNADLALRHAEAAVAAAPADAAARATRAAVALSLGNTAAAVADAEAAVAAEPFEPLAGGVLIRARLLAKDVAGARALVEEYLARHPADEDLNRLKLAILSEAQDMAGLGAQLARLVELLPDRIEYWTALLRWHLETGDPAGGFDRLATRLARPEKDPAVARGFAALAGTLAAAMAADAGPEAARAELVTLVERASEPHLYRLLLAEFDAAGGRTEQAMAALRAMIAAPGAVPAEADAARVALARILFAQKAPEEARTLLEAVLAGDAKNIDALALRAADRIETGRAAEAVTDLNAALGESPRNALLLALAAEANRRLGNPALAGELLARAMQAADYGLTETLRYVDFLEAEGRIDPAATVLTEAVRRRPGVPEFLLRLADLQIRLGRFAEAEATGAELRRLRGDDSLAARVRAASLFSQERYAESIAVLEGLAADPAAREGTMGSLVMAYARAGEADRAEAFLASVLAQNPQNLQAVFLQGWLRESRGDAAGAEERYRALVALEPGLARSHEVLALFLQRRGDDAAAHAALAEGLARVPGAPSLLLQRAGIEERRGEIDAAIASYEAVIAGDPGAIIAINNAVSLITDHRGDDPAMLARARALAAPLQGSTVPQLQDTWGWLLHLSGDTEAAVRVLVPAAEKLPDNPWVRYHAGMALAKLGQAEAARGHLEAALSLAGTAPFPPAETVRATLRSLVN